MRKLLLTALTHLMTVYAFAQSTPDIPFELLPSGHLLVKAKADGVEGNFVFDTGGGLTVFTKTFFEKLKQVKKEDGGYTGFRATGERLDIDLYTIPSFEFGGIKKANAEISYIDANLGGIDGIISLKAVEEQPFTIDYSKKLIRMESAQTLAVIKKAAKQVPVQLEQSRDKSLTLFAYFKVNDTLHLQLSLDSGAGKDVFRLNSKYMKALGVNGDDTTRVKRIQKRSEMNEQFVSNIYLTKLDKLSAAQSPAISTSNFPVQFLDDLIYDGIIWINWMGKEITFDLKGKALYVKQ